MNFEYQEGPRIIYSCKGCIHLNSSKWSKTKEYWCMKYNDVKIKTTLVPLIECQYMKKILDRCNRKLKLEKLDKLDDKV